MPGQRIAIEEAMRISEMAFLPCRATTKADSSDASFSLQVTNTGGKEMLSISHIARSQYADPDHLAACWKTLGGVVMSAWSMPPSSSG